MAATGETGRAQGDKPQAGSHPDLSDRSDRHPSLAPAGRLRSEQHPTGAGPD